MARLFDAGCFHLPDGTDRLRHRIHHGGDVNHSKAYLSLRQNVSTGIHSVLKPSMRAWIGAEFFKEYSGRNVLAGRVGNRTCRHNGGFAGASTTFMECAIRRVSIGVRNVGRGLLLANCWNHSRSDVDC